MVMLFGRNNRNFSRLDLIFSEGKILLAHQQHSFCLRLNRGTLKHSKVDCVQLRAHIGL